MNRGRGNAGLTAFCNAVDRVNEWLGDTGVDPLEDVKVEWVAPHGTPGVVAAQFSTSNGLVRI